MNIFQTILCYVMAVTQCLAAIDIYLNGENLHHATILLGLSYITAQLPSMVKR